MIVIADTTPLNHLILIDQADLLQALYGRVIIPQTVLSELQAHATPQRVKTWVSKRPDWLEVNRSSFGSDPSLARLDAGERDAILLAQKLGADLLLMDDLGTPRGCPSETPNCGNTYCSLPWCPSGPCERFPGDRRATEEDWFSRITVLRCFQHDGLVRTCQGFTTGCESYLASLVCKALVTGLTDRPV